jgi:hypothetical protein
MNISVKSCFVLALALLAGGLNVVSSSCSTAEPPQGDLVEFSSNQRPKDSGLEFSVPEGWIEETPSSTMRKSQFRLPGPKPLEGDAEVAVFAGVGGSVEENVARWIKQFEAAESPQVTKRVINNFPVTFVDVTGTFSAGMMTAGAVPKQGYRMLAAVIETGGAAWFVKLVGPQDTVTKWETSFASFVESVK